jgi:small subunit ribosomal protein S8
MNDPISDLMARIRNAGLARHASTRIPFSRIKARIVEILDQEGYIDSFAVDKKDELRTDIVVNLKYLDDHSLAIHKMQRVSRPGRRVYKGAKEIPKIKGGLGVAIVSTSKGLVTDRDARRLNVGGEVLCEIW